MLLRNSNVKSFLFYQLLYSKIMLIRKKNRTDKKRPK